MGSGGTCHYCKKYHCVCPDSSGSDGCCASAEPASERCRSHPGASNSYSGDGKPNSSTGLLQIADSSEVFSWPEFKAFAKRLGISDRATRKLTIRIAVGEIVEIQEAYLGQDLHVADTSERVSDEQQQNAGAGHGGQTPRP